MRYRVSVLECWLLAWVLLDTTNSVGLQCQTPINIEVARTNETNFLAGYVEVLCDGLRRPVCDDTWDQNGARVVCEQLGFTLRGYCSHPCLGVSDNNGAGVEGVNLTGCTETTQDLTDCTLQTTSNCNRAGVICVTDISITPPVCPTPSSTWTTCTACNCSCPIGGGLGALVVSLGLALVGVVMGWVWHCQRKNSNLQQNSDDAAFETLSNPTYCSFAPSTQYSSQSPGDMPPNTSPTVTETSFATYDVVRAEYQEVGEEGGGEGEYHVLREEEGEVESTYEELLPTAALEQEDTLNKTLTFPYSMTAKEVS